MFADDHPVFADDLAHVFDISNRYYNIPYPFLALRLARLFRAVTNSPGSTPLNGFAAKFTPCLMDIASGSIATEELMYLREDNTLHSSDFLMPLYLGTSRLAAMWVRTSLVKNRHSSDKNRMFYIV